MVQTCEALCEEIRRSVGLTLFRIEFARRPTPLVITLRTSEPITFDPRHDWMRRGTAARIELPLVYRDRPLGAVRIEDERRSEYAEDALIRAEKVVGRYVRELADLLDEGQL